MGRLVNGNEGLTEEGAFVVFCLYVCLIHSTGES